MQYKKPPIRSRKIRFALVGCGRISKNHFEALSAHAKDAEIVSICDTDHKALEEAASQTQAHPYTKLSDMLAHTNADIVVLTTPSGLHSQQAIEVAQSSRHVLTEKPMATMWYDGLRMVKACDDASVQLFVVKQNRFNPPLQHLKKAIEENRFGKIYMVTINVFWTRPQAYYDSAKWRGTREMDGGAFMNQASHYIDLLTWLIGPVESIQAFTGTLARHIEVEDTGVMNVKWCSGALGSVNVTMLTYPKNLEGSITILGEQGTVRIGGVAVNEIQIWDFANKKPEDETIQQTNYSPTNVYGSGHIRYYENVIQVLRGEGSPLTDGREGLKSLEILCAAYQSAREDRRIPLPMDA
ncbi:MAG: Gfo/Idh/MocA family oxidoreductase [Gammaproteobacteria bacterium]|jgi:UDP-N-acetyl-2-amino-2-deoxyglucuronate dehydrogenase|nr:Gfo/Idh/MocA family oxidoreductase [Gammaproteobacteria bacterium]